MEVASKVAASARIMAKFAVEVIAMALSWDVEDEHLACHWSDVGRMLPYHPSWVLEAENVEGSYLEPMPNFAEHSPFGGPSWFEWYSGS